MSASDGSDTATRCESLLGDVMSGSPCPNVVIQVVLPGCLCCRFDECSDFRRLLYDGHVTRRQCESANRPKPLRLRGFHRRWQHSIVARDDDPRWLFLPGGDGWFFVEHRAVSLALHCIEE